MRPRYRRQRDLFEPDRQIQEVSVAQRREAIRLIEDLLREAVGVGGAEAQCEDRATREAAHEQDDA